MNAGKYHPNRANLADLPPMFLVRVTMKPERTVPDFDHVMALSQSKKGREKALAVVAKHAGPVHEVDPTAPDLLVERPKDGAVRRGHFANRQFIPTE